MGAVHATSTTGSSRIPYGMIAAAGRPAETIDPFDVRRLGRAARRRLGPRRPPRRAGPRRRGRRGALPVGRHAALQPPRRRLQEGLLRRVQPLDRRVPGHAARAASSGVGQTALRSVEEGIADLERIRDLGLRGVMLPGLRRLPRRGGDYDDPRLGPALGGRRRARPAALVPHPHRPARRADRRGLPRPEDEQLPRHHPRLTRTSSAR